MCKVRFQIVEKYLRVVPRISADISSDSTADTDGTLSDPLPFATDTDKAVSDPLKTDKVGSDDG